MWTIKFTNRFNLWLNEQQHQLQERVLAALGNLEMHGPRLPRPYADTVKCSKHANMKELRIQYTGQPIRVFFAFDPKRQAIILCAGDKRAKKSFYQTMIHIADDEFTAYLALMEKNK